MAGTGDEALSTKLEHLIGSTKNQAEITSCEAFRAALLEGHERCKASKAELDGAVKAVDDDKIENSTAALTFSEALNATVEELKYTWDDGRNRLLNLRPAERRALGEVELKRRRDFFEINLDMPPSRFSSTGRTAATSKLSAIFQRLSGAPAYFPSEALATLGEKLDALTQAHEAVIAEALDDHPLIVALETARAQATSSHVAMRELLSGVLRFEESPSSVNEFILRTSRRAATDGQEDSSTEASSSEASSTEPSTTTPGEPEGPDGPDALP